VQTLVQTIGGRWGRARASMGKEKKVKKNTEFFKCVQKGHIGVPRGCDFLRGI